jgi:hypothetical protein
MTGGALSRAVEVGESGFAIAYQQRSFREPGAAHLLDPRMQECRDILYLLRFERRERGHAEGWPALL